jgi:hypothetical protein
MIAERRKERANMISYKGNLAESFKSASQDSTWTNKEKEILAEIAEAVSMEGWPDELQTKDFGSGRIYWIKGKSKYKFLAHESTAGYNIGKV